MNTINDLRSALFETLQAVKTEKMDIDRAKSICDISQTIINTAKVEADFARATGAAVHSTFISAPATPRQTGQSPSLPSIATQIAAAGRSKA